MTWARLDDQFPFNPKVAQLSHQAFRVHVTAICYSAAHLTDGVLEAGALAVLRVPPKITRELVDAGLWEEISPGMYRIHDYLDYNPSREKVQAERRADAERKRRRKPGGKPSDSREDSTPASTQASGFPDPTRPVPDPEVLPLASQNGSSTGVGGVGGDPSPGDLLSWIELVPPGIDAGQARYLLGKCAMAATSWAEDLNHPASREVLVSEYVQRPGPFVEALQRADDLGPGTIDNPVGWLRSMVLKLGKEA